MLALLLSVVCLGAQVESPAARLLVVTGTVSRSGHAELDPFLIVDAVGPAEEAPHSEGAAYVFELLDAGGAALARADLDLRFEQEVHGPEASEVRAIEITPFSLSVPLPLGAVKARLRHGATVLAERARTEHAPTIEVTKLGVDSDGTVDLRWRARDADTDPLTYAVFYSPDGRSYESVAIDLEPSELRFDLDRLGTAPGEGAALRVRASDGWNVADATEPLPRRR